MIIFWIIFFYILWNFSIYYTLTKLIILHLNLRMKMYSLIFTIFKLPQLLKLKVFQSCKLILDPFFLFFFSYLII